HNDPGQADITPQTANQIQDATTCSSAPANLPASGFVDMTGNPATTTCAQAIPGFTGSANLQFDSTIGACVATPALTPPVVATVPNLPVYSTQVCDSAGISGGTYGAT